MAWRRSQASGGQVALRVKRVPRTWTGPRNENLAPFFFTPAQFGYLLAPPPSDCISESAPTR